MDQSAFDILFKTNAPHILENIFFSLDYESYKKCHEVCKVWNRLLSSQSMKKKTKKMLLENRKNLKRAIDKGNTDEVGKILSMGMVDVNYEMKKFPWTFLHLAVDKGYHTVAKELLEAGADVNGPTPTRGGILPLGKAILTDNIGIAQLLLDKGANPNKFDKYGSTTLHKAATFHDKNMIKLLIEEGAEINKQDISGKTPLIVAADWGNQKAVQMLLDMGADPTIPDSKGETPESWARQNGHLTVIKMLTD